MLPGECEKHDVRWSVAEQERSGCPWCKLEASQKALRGFVDAAKSWHDFHHGSSSIACDWFCENIKPGEDALKL